MNVARPQSKTAQGVDARPAPWRASAWMMVALLFTGVSSARGQSFAIDWFAIAGGGGASSGGNYSLVGTIGQSDAGIQSGGSFLLSGGFWSAIQISDLPSLLLRRSSTNTVIISWPALAAGFELQQNPEVATTNWSNVSVSPAIVGDEKQVILP